MAEPSDNSVFNVHMMKAQLFNEMVVVVNRIFEEREAHVANLERRALEANLVSQRKLQEEILRTAQQLESKTKQLESSVISLTMRTDRNEQQLQLTSGGLDVLSALVDGNSIRMEGELEQMKLLSGKQSEQFQQTYTKVIDTLKREEEKWNVWYLQLLRVSNTHQRLIDDTLAGEKLLSDQVTNQNKRLLTVQQHNHRLENLLQSHRKELAKLIGLQCSFEKLLLQSAENSSKLSELENFIEKYQPIYSYAQVSDVMFAVMDDKLRKRLQQIDKKMLAEFSSVTSVDKGIPNLRRKVITSTETINRIMLRNKPYEQLEESNEVQQMQNYYEEKLDREILQLTQRLQKQLKDLQKTVSTKLEETTKQVVLDLNESTEMVSFRMGKAEDKLESIGEQLRKLKQEGRPMKKIEGITTELQDSMVGDLERKPATALSQVDFGAKLEQITRRVRQANRLSHRREPSDQGNLTQRYEGVHRSGLASELGSIGSATNCLVPDNVVEMRRRSLIDMRRNKIVPSSKAEARP